ncbi:transcriptional regulator family: Fungal Specific TF [Penicillium concentricum]|uniref:Transcriptional regulator family: Fungal Specific TF n=1 Tax=Penicillium concentricum TaxID=293559 RepID=A0A9W9S9A8_9EURO|nr:transcriptional regulator family: Fungal Specific TF [Penicillium concentricum]KAJ5371953.1 transcriptional regulator family: Fungal Specific TF [Penicillium concentricum]
MEAAIVILTTVYCLASILVLTLARHSSMLAHLVPDIDTLQNIAIETLELWRSSGSSIERAHEMAISIRAKQPSYA